jgi:hypothetical protein
LKAHRILIARSNFPILIKPKIKRRTVGPSMQRDGCVCANAAKALQNMTLMPLNYL